MEDSIFLDKGENVWANKLLDSYHYWAKKWILFNIPVGLAGVISILVFSGFHLSLFDIFGIFCWGIVANILYTAGYVSESVIIIGSKGEKDIIKLRGLLFWVGTIAYMLVSAAFSFFYFLHS